MPDLETELAEQEPSQLSMWEQALEPMPSDVVTESADIVHSSRFRYSIRAPEKYNAEELREISIRITDGCPWDSLPGGSDFWLMVCNTLSHMAAYAEGKQPKPSESPIETWRREGML